MPLPASVISLAPNKPAVPPNRPDSRTGKNQKQRLTRDFPTASRRPLGQWRKRAAAPYQRTGSECTITMHDPRWDSLSDAEWDAFARAWVAELSDRPPESLPDSPQLFENAPEVTASAFVVPMNSQRPPMHNGNSSCQFLAMATMMHLFISPQDPWNTF